MYKIKKEVKIIKNKDVVQKAFRFSNATADNLRELVTLGIVRNETEAVDLAIMHFLTEKKTEKRFMEVGNAPAGISTENNILFNEIFSERLAFPIPG